MSKKFKEFPMALPWHALADRLAFQNVRRGKQCCGPIALVIVCHGSSAPLLQRQSGLRAIRHLNLAFFFDAKHKRVLG